MAGPVRIAILANGAQARSEITRTGTAMSKLGGFAKAGILAAGVGLVALGKSAITAEAEFSTSMRLIQAATKAPAADMQRLNDLAIKLGAETSFSAKDAADAMLELAKAGLSTKTIMGGGVAGTLTLAAAGGTDLATAATIASNALNTFGLRGRDMAKVAAALAGGANASSASVESLGQGLQQVGPGATNAGLSLQETVAALSAFDAAGIKGSDAGTSLKTMLTRLVPQTDKAAGAMKRLNLDFTKGNGEFVSLANMAEQLQRGLGKLSAEQRTTALATLFGSDASRAATVLMKEGAEGVREFTKATNDQNAAQQMADARMGGTAGALEALSGSIETAQLRLGQELAPAVEATANFLAMKLVPAMDGAIDVTKSIGRELEPVGNAMMALGGFAKDAAGWIGDLPGPIKEIGIQAGIAALVLPRLTTAVTGAAGSFTTAVAKAKQFNAEMSYAATRTQRVQGAMTAMGGAARAAAGVGGMVALTQGAQSSSTAMRTLANVGGGALLGFSMGGPIGGAIGAGAGALLSLYQATKKTSDGMSEADQKAAGLADQIDAIAAASGRARRAEMLRLLQMDGEVIPAARSLGIETNVLIAALNGNDKAVTRINRSWKTHSGVVDSIHLEKINRFLRDQGFELDQSEAAIRENARALRVWDGKVNETAQRVPKANNQLGKLGNVNPSGRWVNTYTSQLDHAGKLGRDKTARNNQILRAETAKARGDWSPFINDLSSSLNSAQARARSGGLEIGNALEQGIVSGFSGAASQLATNAYSAVANAVREARRAADARSPSRKMMALGKDMADGLAIGMTGGSARSLLSIKSGGGSSSTTTLGHSFPRELTLVVDGHPMRAIVRREMASDRRWRDRMDDRD